MLSFHRKYEKLSKYKTDNFPKITITKQITNFIQKKRTRCDVKYVAGANLLYYFANGITKFGLEKRTFRENFRIFLLKIFPSVQQCVQEWKNWLYVIIIRFSFANEEQGRKWTQYCRWNCLFLCPSTKYIVHTFKFLYWRWLLLSLPYSCRHLLNIY